MGILDRERLLRDGARPLIPGLDLFTRETFPLERPIFPSSQLFYQPSSQPIYQPSAYELDLQQSSQEFELQQAKQTSNNFQQNQRWLKDQLSIANPEFGGLKNYLQQELKDSLKSELNFLESLSDNAKGYFSDRINDIRKQLREL